MSAKTRAEWGKIISDSGVPCGPIKDISEIVEDPQVLHREMVVEVEHAKTGTLRMMGIPIKLSDTPGAVTLPPPLLGEHTDEILCNLLDIGTEEVASLREKGVV